MTETAEKMYANEQLAVLNRIAVALEKIAKNTDTMAKADNAALDRLDRIVYYLTPIP